LKDSWLTSSDSIERRAESKNIGSPVQSLEPLDLLGVFDMDKIQNVLQAWVAGLEDRTAKGAEQSRRMYPRFT